MRRPYMLIFPHNVGGGAKKQPKMSHQISKINDMYITYIPKTTKYQFFSSVNANYKLN